MKSPFIKVLIITILYGIPSYSHGQNDSISTPTDVVSGEEMAAPFDMFGKEESFEMTITFNLKAFVKGKYKDEYQPAEMTVVNEGKSITEPVRIRARGEFRRGFCYYPPIKFNFDGKGVTAPSFKHLDKLKLVTICKKNKTYQQYIYKEYLTYKIYNLLTPKSFDVRLVNMTYRDGAGKKKPVNYDGFFIEATDMMANRNNAFEIEPERINSSMTARNLTTLVSVFQFMIGNTDWVINNQHNCKLIRSNEFSDTRIYPVPYDFDYSGIVNAYYAIPSENLPIEKITERLYRGPCRSLSEFQEVFDLFNSKKEEIYSLINEFELLDTSNKKSMTKYLDGFYEIINNKSLAQNQLVEACQ